MSQKIESIVVDASIARAASDKAPEITPVSPATVFWPQRCASFLRGMLAGHYKAVFSEKLKDEWNKHQSRYSAKWWRSMTARKRVCYVKQTFPRLEVKVLTTQTQKKKKDAIEKDFHLVEAALASDQVITSLDDTVRDLLVHAATSINEIRQIVWGNPGNPEENLSQWLKAGAPTEAKRQLGYKIKGQ